MAPLLEAVKLSFTYPDGTRALQNVTLSIPPGKKIAVLGPNGAGKSTLFLHFNGILRPQEGCIYFAGNRIDYSHKALINLRRQVGIVFQDPDSMLFSASVRQEISFGPLNLGLARDEVAQRVEAALVATGIADLRDKPTHFLSYGQKKRVAIASVLAMEPRVIIFDEPTAYLDPRSTREVMALLADISRQGKTIILSTHDVDIAYTWADYIYIMARGRVIGAGTPAEIFCDAALLETADLARPWLLEVYEDLKNKGWLPATAPVPQKKEELLGLIPYRSRSILAI
ncbi:energy-coupling factor ABC transporter ATP-binding protein [Moorella sulfitireducens]|uniref:energy-coupling factor ABC transporter ATP-binding protein n=1 Tax=Neomoorella sulfitireducens TaxID=2972948 RepID=UPI0021AC818E|nr:ATP-binding cassette domain-containing protein [Moorella sulfitireducens]